MRVNITNIPAEGLHLDIVRNPEWLYAFIPDRGGVDFSIHDIVSHCFLRKDLNTVLIEGEVTARLVLGCCRCLENYELPVHGWFRYELVPAESIHEAAEKELTVDDFEAGIYRDDIIDLDPIVAEQVILQIPVKPLCKDSCRGLCPVCGGNLNVRTCRHETAPAESPFAVLKDFKVKMKG